MNISFLSLVVKYPLSKNPKEVFLFLFFLQNWCDKCCSQNNWHICERIPPIHDSTAALNTDSFRKGGPEEPKVVTGNGRLL